MINPAIPDFDIHGVLPPIRPGQDGVSADRAPYITDALTFCQRFGGTSERRVILRGWLDLRALLASAGLADGFQWINGSFCEAVEIHQGRMPGDVDVVTFARLGDQRALLQSIPDAMDPRRSKLRFHVDHYPVATDVPLTMGHGHTLAYGSSLWSHRRGDNRWKGFVAVSMASNDADALLWLEHAEETPPQGGGAP
jgi:hypothetical protein